MGHYLGMLHTRLVSGDSPNCHDPLVFGQTFGVVRAIWEVEDDDKSPRNGNSTYDLII